MALELRISFPLSQSLFNHLEHGNKTLTHQSNRLSSSARASYNELKCDILSIPQRIDPSFSASGEKGRRVLPRLGRVGITILYFLIRGKWGKESIQAAKFFQYQIFFRIRIRLHFLDIVVASIIFKSLSVTPVII